MEVKSVSLGCFLTLADVYAFMCVIFHHWRFYLWSWVWRVPPVPPSLLRLQKSPVVTIPTSRTSIYWVPNHFPGPNNVCTCYLLYSSQKPYEAYDIIIPYFTSEETETQNGQVTCSWSQRKGQSLELNTGSLTSESEYNWNEFGTHTCLRS